MLKFVLDPANPAQSDVIGTWTGVPPTPQDPFYCPNDPLTGAPQARQVHMIFQCAPGVQTASLYKAVQNTTEACHYRLYFKTQHVIHHFIDSSLISWGCAAVTPPSAIRPA